MATKFAQPPLDVALAELVARQHGVISLRQMQLAGITASGVRDRVASKRLHRVHAGVYAVGHPRLSREGHWKAAVLACGEGAVLSHRSAAALLGLRPTARHDIDVTVPTRTGRARAGITVHRTTTLPGEQTTTHDGIPTTTAARTLLDLTDVLDRRGIERAVEHAERLHLFDLAQIHAVLQRANGRKHTHLLVDAVRIYDPQTALTRSDLETTFQKLCREARLPQPATNALIEGLEVDFSWREHHLVAELDGHATHGTRAAFERDRVRDQQLTAAGWRVIRFTYRQVTDHPDDVRRTLRALLTRP